MAEAATTRPARTRKTTTPTAATMATKTAKAAVAKPATTSVAAPAVTVTDEGMTKIGFTMESAGETKSYAKFTPPASSGCVGNIYAPLGTLEVKVLLIGPSA